MKFKKEELAEGLELLQYYGNQPDIRSKDFRAFVYDSYDKKFGIGCHTASEFIRICIDAFRSLTEDDEK